MVNWQITATTIYCDAVDDEVTIMVFKNATTKCTGLARYTQPNRETGKLVKAKAARLKREFKCGGPDCPQVAQYRDKLFAEEHPGSAG